VLIEFITPRWREHLARAIINGSYIFIKEIFKLFIGNHFINEFKNGLFFAPCVRI